MARLFFRWARIWAMVIFGALIALFVAVVATNGQEATPEFPEGVKLTLYGRFLDDVTLAVSPRGREVAEVDQGAEFYHYANDIDDSGSEAWLFVTLLDESAGGWLPLSEVEFAEPTSTREMRRYLDGWCNVTPTTDVITRSWEPDEHFLVFDESLNLEELEFTLFFNGDLQDFDEVEENTIRLPWHWVIRHGGEIRPPAWDDVAAWTLVFFCGRNR